MAKTSTVETVERAHAELGPSSSKRWMHCPGSVPLSRGVEDRPSAYAAEGSVAHAIGEAAILNKGEIKAKIGDTVTHDGFEILVTAEMLEAVDIYVRTVMPYVKAADFWAIECRVELLSSTRIPIFGTSDFLAVEGNTLIIGDYKHGKGVAVDVEWNSQVLMYGLMTYECLQRDQPKLAARIRRIQFLVVQPRIDGTQVKMWDVDLVDLLMWRDEELLPAIERIAQGEGELADGDWCRFCPALPTCPLKIEKATAAAKELFAMEGEEVDNTSLGSALALVRSIQDYAKAVETMAVERLSRGELVPGWKLVEGRSNRAWADEDETLNAINARTNAPEGLMDEVLTEPELKSPAHVEKVLKSYGFTPAKILDGLIVKPPGKPALVAASDPRPALTSVSAAEAFSDTDEDV